MKRKLALLSATAGLVLLLPAKHDYSVGPNIICPAAWHCSKELIQSIYLQVRNGVPGNTAHDMLIDGQKYNIYHGGVFVGQIVSHVTPDVPAVSNKTTAIHIFFDGWAQRTTYHSNGIWYSTTRGFGTNYYIGAPIALANQVFGPGIFERMDAALASQLQAASHRN